MENKTMQEFKLIAEKLKAMEKEMLNNGLTRKDINKLKGKSPAAKKEKPAEYNTILTTLKPKMIELQEEIGKLFESTITAEKKPKGLQYYSIDFNLKYNILLHNKDAAKKPVKKEVE